MMRATALLGIILIVLGIIAIGYQGISYTTHKKIVDLGPIQATKTEHKTIPVSPLVGVLALIGGVGLVLAGRKEA
jgi:uncharacterized membrane protein HdeD (DUF308 family)